MAKEMDFEKLEKDYQKSKGKEQYKGKQDYAQKMSMKELDEYAKRYQKGGNSQSLKDMGQEALAYVREYQAMLDAHEAKKKAGAGK